LPQTFGLYPKLSAREMLHYIALLKGIVDRQIREQRVEYVLQRTGLFPVAERKVGTYSRGMRQKVGIAQVLLEESPVLILDEPTAGLDPEARNNLQGLLVDLGRERVVVMASSFIADTFCADRVLVLGWGERLFWGTPAELAACAATSNHSPLMTDEGAQEKDWSERLEQGYRAILLDRESQ
jgi:ABC-2 type transport system ATP-binding protein